MGIYRTICYKVEDAFVKIMTGKQDADIVREKVSTYRTERENKKAVKEQENTSSTQRANKNKSL